MLLKSSKKGLTLVEILVVILIISILIAISSGQYNKLMNNSRVKNVGNDLSGWMSDINQYIEDYGAFKIRTTEAEISSENEYLSYLYYGDKTVGVSGITKGSSNYASSSPLNILQSYCTNSFVIEDPELDVDFEKQYIILTTKSKKDPWGQKYKIICDTKKGTIIVTSAGIDTQFSMKYYSEGKFGDDIILVVSPKE